MNELATIAFYRVDKFPKAPFETARDYFKSLTNEHITHLWTQRNLSTDPENARKSYIARHLFAKLIDRYCIDNRGSFKLFCDGLRPPNMLVDPDTLRITAVLDLEFTNAMPSPFASEPPWWLLLAGPDSYLFRGHAVEEFVTAYEPCFERFLQAMQKAENKKGMLASEKSLSYLMRESWLTRRFWFNIAARKPCDIDDLFANCLDESGGGIESLDGHALAALDSFVDMKMKQLKSL
jgi:hypothetical protein